MVSKIWQFLTTDVKELNWKQTTEVTKAGADAGKAVLDLAKAVQDKKTDLGQYVGEITSLLDVLNSPIVSVIKETIPFAPIAVTMLQLIFEGTKQEPTLVQCVALMSQSAYLESLRSVLGTTEGLELVARLNERSVSDSVKQAIKKVGDLSLDRSEAEKVIVNFSETALAKVFNVALVARLVDAGVSEAEAETWAQRVVWTTPRFFNEAVAAAKDKVKTLAELFSKGGRERLERYSSLDRYLDEKIRPLPLEPVLGETDLCYADIYVSSKVQPLIQNGSDDPGRKPVQLEDEILRVLNDPKSKAIVVFLQGEAGQGKSVFCRMFSDRVRRELYPSFIPILIRLRDLRKLANNLTETLTVELQYCDFVTTDSGWLTDPTQRFLFLLDGFDELLLQGGVKSGDTGGLKDFLEQVEQFQKNHHHRFVITGRPLSLQGIDRLISQSKNLARLSLCPMQDDDRNQWLDKWSVKFGVAERQEFEAFLNACPDDVNNKLAREPLLLYLLGRMHRERAISASELQGTSGMRAKVKVYDEAIKWVLLRQREDENLRITALESDDLRQLLMEAALCVVQTGNETARVSMLEERLKGNDGAIVEMIAKSRASADVSEQKTLNNLLTTFYIKPAAVDQEGSIEFAHKSFGEFLFAERLKEAIEDWSKPSQLRREKYLIADENFNWQIYDLLGYGGLTKEIVDYLMVMLEKSQKWQQIVLFERLNQFWESWCDGEFIDAPPENLPQKKMRMLREQMPDREKTLGLRQVDVHSGLNILILLLSLRHYDLEHNELKDKIEFHPNRKLTDRSNLDSRRLCEVIHYADCLEFGNFGAIVGLYLRGADLCQANLRGVDLRGCLKSQSEYKFRLIV